MPELPDITVYLEALERRVVGQVLEKIRLENNFVLRTAVPPIDSLEKRRVIELRRIGKRIAFGFEGDRWLVLHLMIAGRLQWTEVGTPLRGGRRSGARRGSNPGRLGEPSLPALTRQNSGGVGWLGSLIEEGMLGDRRFREVARGRLQRDFVEQQRWDRQAHDFGAAAAAGAV